MKLYNLGLFGVTYTKQLVVTGKNAHIKHKIKLLTIKQLKQLRTFLSW